VVRNVAVDDDKFLFVGLAEAREWRSRRGRSGKRKIAIGHRSMAQLSSSRLIPAGPAHPEKSPVLSCGAYMKVVVVCLSK
jgi:hypothetical protein